MLKIIPADKLLEADSNKCHLAGPRSVTEEHLQIYVKIGVKQQKTNLFDRFFHAIFGGLNGV